MLCPKCGFEQTPNGEDGRPRVSCQKCDVVFAKISLACPRCRHVAKGLEIKKPNNCPECGVDVKAFLASRKPLQVDEPPEETSPPVVKPNGSDMQYFCPSCSQYFPNAGKKGNGWIEFILYLCYFIPGVIYSIWRRSSGTVVCPKCKSSSIISASAGTHVKCPDCRELILKDAKKCKNCGAVLKPQ